MIRNQKGQVAIFIALIFQVLFLFFAMVINVGMLVHQKINLQNSVDLAAYYGAMKQAESLNAIAHINYQIRQDWKLLTWRYRVIGMGGDLDSCHPYDKPSRSVLPSATEDGPYQCSKQPAYDEAAMFDNYLQASFCATYIPFKPMPPGETTCRDLTEYKATPTLNIPPKTGIVSISSAIQAATIQALKNIQKRCEYVGQFNWILLARFKAAFIRDQGTRRLVANLIAGDMSGAGLPDPTADFRELNGDQASTGIQKTFLNNLTPANRDSLKDPGNGMNIYNSLGAPDCLGHPTTEHPPAWLNEVNIFPAFATVLTLCDNLVTGGKKIQYVPAALEEVDNPVSPGAPQAYAALNQYVQNNGAFVQEFASLKGLVGTYPAPYNASLGYEKNPWCNAYVGVKAVTAPKIPFLPLREIKLQATAFAKPFGGKIGPWVYKKWAPGDKKSAGGDEERTDMLVPKRVDDPTNVNQTALKDKTRIPNFSRFPGDTKGMISRAVLGYYTRAIFESDSSWRSKSTTAEAQNFDPENAGDQTPSFDQWRNVAQDFVTENKDGDILAYQQGIDEPLMRRLELSAVSPDIFDITYYSIEPNFYENYYEKIQQHIKKAGKNFFLLSDFGSRLTDEKLKKFSVKDQITKQNDLTGSSNTATNLQLAIPLKEVLQYTVLDPTHVLTSWLPHNDTLEDYSLDETRFGKCPKDEEPDPKYPIPGNCVNAGRTGFSVKLVNGNYLNQTNLKLGGENSPAGGIKNPPPADWLQ